MIKRFVAREGHHPTKIYRTCCEYTICNKNFLVAIPEDESTLKDEILVCVFYNNYNCGYNTMKYIGGFYFNPIYHNEEIPKYFVTKIIKEYLTT